MGQKNSSPTSAHQEAQIFSSQLTHNNKFLELLSQRSVSENILTSAGPEWARNLCISCKSSFVSVSPFINAKYDFVTPEDDFFQFFQPSILRAVTEPKDFEYLPNVTHLFLDPSYNSSLPSVPKSLQHLNTGGFAHALPELPPSLTSLTLGHAFNHVIISLPPALTSLFCVRYNLPLPSFPESLESLTLPGYQMPLHPLPPNLKRLVIDNYHLALPPLPDSLEYLSLGNCFTRELPNIPSSLKLLEVGAKYDLDKYQIKKDKVQISRKFHELPSDTYVPSLRDDEPPSIWSG